uniref:Thioredoxin domain-containing protein n=1 Tax=viral metagenome TaxID=1070528 RepID=A0A6C0J269_9ZZZZ
MKETSSKSKSVKSKSVKSKSKSKRTQKRNRRLKELKSLEKEFNTIFQRKPESKKETKQPIVDKKPIVVVLLHATWCGHCKYLRPEWDEMKKNLGSYITDNNIIFEELESDGIKEKLSQLSQRYMNNKEIQYKGFPTIGSIQDGVFEPYTNPRDSENLSIWVKSLNKMSGGTTTMPNTPKASKTPKTKNSPSSRKKRTISIDKTSIKPKALFTNNINSINKAFDDMYKPDKTHNTSNRINPKIILQNLGAESPLKPSIMGHGLPDLKNIRDSPKTRIDRRRLANETYAAKQQIINDIRKAGEYLEPEPKYLGTMKVKTPTPKKGTPKTPNSRNSTPGGIFFN